MLPIFRCTRSLGESNHDIRDTLVTDVGKTRCKASANPIWASFRILDQRVCDLFPTETARQIADELERRDHLMFFSKWQLLSAIKLTCVFASRDKGGVNGGPVRLGSCGDAGQPSIHPLSTLALSIHARHQGWSDIKPSNISPHSLPKTPFQHLARDSVRGHEVLG